MISTTYHSQKAENRPPPSKPRPALRGGVSRREGAKRPPAFIPHKNRTPALPKKSGEKVMGRLGVILPPDATPIPGASPSSSTAGHTGANTAFHGAGGVRMPPGYGKGHTGLQNAKHGLSQFELLLAKKRAGSWPSIAAGFFSSCSTDSASHAGTCPTPEGFNRSPSSCS